MISFIWNGNLAELYTFLHKLNNLAPSIKLTWEVSDQKVNFLDMLIFKDPENHTKLITKPYQKPLNRYLYIPFTSYHPTHAKKSFIKAELIRYVRLSSKLSDFLAIRKKFFDRLQNRGYTCGFLRDTFAEVSYESREKYLSKSKVNDSDRRSLSRIFFKTFRNPLFYNIHLRNLFLFHLGKDFDVTHLL